MSRVFTLLAAEEAKVSVIDYFGSRFLARASPSA